MVTAAPPSGPTAPPMPRERAEGADTSPWRLDWRPWVFSGVLAMLVGLFALATPIYTSYGSMGLWHGSLATLPLAQPLVFLGSVSAVAGVLLSRRSAALACVLATWPFLLVVLIGTFVWAWWLALLAIATARAYDGARRAMLPLALTLLVAGAYCSSRAPALLPIGPVTAGSGDTRFTFVVYAVASLASVAVSAAIGMGHRAASRAAAANRASAQALVVETVASERARIAHDLHDVVAHHVSLVAVRAESAPYVHPSMDDDAKAVLADIADDARHALGELRQVLAVLQRTEGADRAPQPGSADVEALVDAARSAGQSVTVDGDVPALAPAPGLVLYRAVQESLTNARRHAPGQPVSLTFRTGAAPSGRESAPGSMPGPGSVAGPGPDTRPWASDDETPAGGPDRGAESRRARTPAPAAVSARVSSPLAPGASPGGPGRGLVGMRERIESIGGRLTAGEEDGSFVVELALPVDEPEPARPPERAESPLRHSTGDPLDVHLLDVPDGGDA
jgi:signal transduction histidine kinase